jgi:hypothetical protein
MQAYETQYVPGQIHVTRLRRGSSIVAIEGTLRLRYRDASLNWLLDAAPVNRVRLGEGEGYRLPCDAFVEIGAAGKTAALGAVEPASTAFARCAAWIANTAIPRWLRPPLPAR